MHQSNFPLTITLQFFTENKDLKQYWAIANCLNSECDIWYNDTFHAVEMQIVCKNNKELSSNLLYFVTLIESTDSTVAKDVDIFKVTINAKYKETVSGERKSFVQQCKSMVPQFG